jgi:hypothetical protein
MVHRYYDSFSGHGFRFILYSKGKKSNEGDKVIGEGKVFLFFRRSYYCFNEGRADLHANVK